MSLISSYLVCAGREIHFTEWTPNRPLAARGTVVAWHGLARTGRDMDELADHLSGLGYRVICPDMIGRGLSQWAVDPKTEYCLAFYARIARELVEQLGSAAITGTVRRTARVSRPSLAAALSSDASTE